MIVVVVMAQSPSPAKRRRRSSPVKSDHDEVIGEYGSVWADWPAPRDAVREARDFILDM